MNLIMLTLTHDVPIDVRRNTHPEIFGIIETKGFIDLQVKRWNGKLNSLPTHPVLIDATGNRAVRGYREYPSPDRRWPRGYPDLADACVVHGHVAFTTGGILIPSRTYKDPWYNRNYIYEDLCILINRVRSLEEMF